MASYESTYPVYYRGTAKIGDNLSVAELERIARNGSKRNPRTSTRKQSSLKAGMKKTAKQTTRRRRVNTIASLAFAGLGFASLSTLPKLFLETRQNMVARETPTTYVSIPQTNVSNITKTKRVAPPCSQ